MTVSVKKTFDSVQTVKKKHSNEAKFKNKDPEIVSYSQEESF